jgi:hypothetical protein
MCARAQEAAAAKVQRAQVAVERAKLPEEVAKHLVRGRVKADKAVSAEKIHWTGVARNI